MKIPALVALVVLASAGSARAADDDTRADVRCVLAMYALMRNPSMTANAFSAALFFTGRLEGRDSKIDVEAELKKELARMSASDYGHEIQRCGDEAKTRSTLLQTVGTGLAAGGKRGIGN